MKKIILKDNVSMYAVKNFKDDGYHNERKGLDIYIREPGAKHKYAFSCEYSDEVYDLCKSSVRVNQISCKKSRNRNLMKFINYLNLMLPYLVKEIELPVVV